MMMISLFGRKSRRSETTGTGRRTRPASVIALLLAAFIFGSALASEGTTTRLVTRTDGGDITPYGDDVSEFTSSSSNGRFAVFASRARYLKDANSPVSSPDYFNVYLYDREGNSGDGQLYLVSRNYNSYSSDSYANGDSRFPTISPDGRFIAFQSSASDLLPPGKDTNEKSDIFLYDVACIQERVYEDYFKSIGYTLGCGEYGGFIYQSIILVSKPDTSMGISVESDGDSGNASQDPYPRIAVMVQSTGNKNPYVFFESNATNLAANDTNGAKDIFVRDVVSNQYTYCLTCSVPGGSAATNGSSYGPVISASGSQMAFVSDANNMTAGAVNNVRDIFLMATDIDNSFAAPTAQLISRSPSSNTPGNEASTYPSITADGSKVAFQSTATNLLPGDGTINYSDIFLWESPNTLKRLSIDPIGRLGDNNSYNPRISSNGNAVAFTSFADNLVEGDNNIDCLVQSNGHWVDSNCPDVFVRETASTEIWRVSITTDGMEAHERSGLAFLSDDAKYIYFLSYAKLEDMGDNVNVQQIFYRNQGSPPGNPNIQPTYWIFYGYPNVGTSHRFYLKFLGEENVDTLEIASAATTSESHFTITADTCTPAIYSGGDSCYIEVKYIPLTTKDHHTAVIRIPLSNDDRSALTIGLEGYGRFMYYVPAVVQQGN